MHPVTIVLLVILGNPHRITDWFVFLWQEDPEETGRTAGTDRSKQTDRFHARY